MPSLIETLIGGNVTRPDHKRLVPNRRPMPTRPRDLFNLFTALGAEASLASLFQSTQLHTAEPRALTFIALNRWPTEAELAELPTPYNGAQHLRAMLLGPEFQASLPSRICDAYPERQRLFHVRIPRCAGEHFLAMANSMHPVVPPALTIRQSGRTALVQALGAYLHRFTLTKTILLSQPTLAPFIRSTQPPADPAASEPPLPWNLNPPPRRPTDRLFTILREPASLILSEVNATLDALLRPADADTPAIAAWRTRLPSPTAADAAGRKQIAREILRKLPMRNPICTALADGTAAEAFRAVRLQDLEMVNLDRYPDWTKYTWDVEPEAATNTSTAHLAPADLTKADRDELDSRIAEDIRFYAPVAAAAQDTKDPYKSAVRGRDL